MITIKELTTQKELKQFVKFPFKLYGKNPYWVPPIISEELETFNPKKNPVFNHASARFFIALKGGEIAGRIAAIMNDNEIVDQKTPKMRFGWFDFIDDKNVSKILLKKVEEIGIQNNLEYMEGPVGFSNLDKVGVLTEGFDEIGSMITWYNHPYYAAHYENLGFKKEKVYNESIFSFENVNPVFFAKASAIIRKRYELRALNFTKTKDIFPYVDEMFKLFNSSYAKLSSFVAISDDQVTYFKKKYISFINPELIKFVVDKNDKLVAFAITMPSFSEALQKANGKLFPFGFYHLLRARKKSKDIILYLIGIHPDFQKKGVTSIIFEEFHKSYEKRGIENCYRTPELATNAAIAALWKNFDPKIRKKRCTFRKNI